MTKKGKEVVEVLDADVLVESNNDNNTDNIVTLQDDILGGDGVIVPEVGMKFKDEKEVFEFYKRYAYDVGFPVRRRNSRKGEDGVVNYITLTCCREGRRNSNAGSSLKPQLTIQTGCKARLTASSDIRGIWKICTVDLEHNHITSPSKFRLYRCNRELTTNVKRKLEVNDMARIPLHKSYNSAVVEVGGYENMTYVEKDCQNYVERVRRLRLGEGDVAAIQSYFSQMQAQCSGFYYCMDLDEESWLRNLFWADKKCRQAYKEFGDVVTFDTTYLTNKYDMPFVPFVGVNHHGQSTLLGCGLLANEDTDTFVWLFRTWMQCMHGQAPNGIITDQDKVMQNAIEIVFPNTRHRWCLWHILKKLPEKFEYHVDKRSIFSSIHDLVYDTQVVEKFEEGWKVMLDTYDLHDNEWLSRLFENRSRWVPCYLKTTFWAGMSTTQRSDSINAFFDGYVHSKTSLKQFVEQYERALRNKVEKEFQADFKSYSQMVPCATKYEMEKQFQAVYTISKFREFQDEITGKVYCDVVSASDKCSEKSYEVDEDVIYEENVRKKKFSVTFHAEDCNVICSCHLFEFRGILCRHAISVLMRNGVTSILERYILRRWRRDISRAHTRVAVNYNGLGSTPSQLRYDRMCEVFAMLADIAADDEERTRVIIDWIRSQTNDMLSTKPSWGSNNISQPSLHLGSQSRASHDTDINSIQDPKCSKRKGAPKKLLHKSSLESSSKKIKPASTSSKGQRSRARKSNLRPDAPIVQSSSRAEYSMLTPLSNSHVIFGDEESRTLTQQLPSTNFIPASTSNVLFKYHGNTMPYYYPDLSYTIGTQLGIINESLRPSAMGVFPLGFHGPSPPPTNVAGWMSSATHTIPYAVVAGGPSNLVQNPSSGVAHQDPTSDIAMTSQDAGSSRRLPFNPCNATQ